MVKKLNRTLQLTLLLTFTVIILGAYTRLKDAGLGCPDWPGCYGKLLAPTADNKAWIEMIHRYVAGTLGFLILYIAIQGIRLRKTRPKLWILTTGILLLVVYQALLGMWTVTLSLHPVVVMGHLLGGFAILSLLWWVYLQVSYQNSKQFLSNKQQVLILTSLSLIALIAQIAIGGWVSANYTALVCADFPTCQGHWWPTMDWQHAFGWPGVPLENNARVTIQMAHRIGAGIVTIFLGVLSYILLRTRNRIFTGLGWVLITFLCLQICLGITNVLAGLPIAISLGHNATAVMLLLCLITILFMANVKSNDIK